MKNSALLRRLVCTPILILAWLMPCGAEAAPVEFNFSGVVTERRDTNNLLGGGFEVGAIFNGNISFDPATASPDLYPTMPGLALYAIPGSIGLSLRAGEHSFVTTFAVVVVQDSPATGAGRDSVEYLLNLQSYDGVPLPSTFTTSYYGINFTTATGNDQLLASDALPTFIPNLMDFESGNFALNGVDPTHGLEFLLLGRVTEVTPVPEPGVMMLLVCGVAGVVVRRARGK